MPDPRRRTSPGRRGALLAALGCAALALAPAGLAAPALESEAIALERAARFFDGVTLEIVVLRSKSMRLETDTLGAWVPLSAVSAPSGLPLHHRVMPDVVLNIRMCGASSTPASSGDWAAYLDDLRKRDGLPVRLTKVGDSTEDPSVFTVTGLQTREVSLLVRDPATGSLQAEHQVIGFNDGGALLVTLSGPAAKAEAALPDLRFFLARLERR